MAKYAVVRITYTKTVPLTDEQAAALDALDMDVEQEVILAAIAQAAAHPNTDRDEEIVDILEAK